MDALRFLTAADVGALDLPDGRVLVIGARAGMDLSGLGPDVQVITGFRPDYEALTAAGHDVQLTPEGRFDAALVLVPRSRVAARAAIALAAASVDDGMIAVEGAKTDGIEGLMKDLRNRVTLDGSYSKAHGRVIWFRGGSFEDWAAEGEMHDVGGFMIRPGVFSADGPDRGSVLLAQTLPPLKGVVVDLGAGWGYLAGGILASPTVTALHLVEADHDALDCARRNVTDPRAEFHWADATRFDPGQPVDTIVTNPPFHTTRAADPSLGRAFIDAARRMLRPSGQLWLVANRHLPYEDALNKAFTEVAEMAGDPAFKLFRAARPRRAK